MNALLLILVLPLQSPETFEITIFHTGDFRSAFDKAPVIARIVQEERETGRPVLLVDTGNHLDPVRLETHAFQGEMNIDIMNRMGYDAMVIGEGELQYGPDALRKRFDEARFPLLAANISAADSEPVLAFPYWTPLRDLGGLRVGIIGVASLKGCGEHAAKRVRTWCRLEGGVADATRYARMLASDVDLVVVLSNAGIKEDMRILTDGGAHLLIGGYSDLPVRQIQAGGSMVWAERRDGYLGKVRVRIQREPSIVELVSYEAVTLDGEGDPDIAEAIEEWKARILEGAWKAVVGESTGAFSRTRSADLIADSVRLAGRAEIAVCNSEEVLRPLPEGTITRRDLWALLPMDRHVVTFSITGAEVRALVEANLRGGGALRFSGLSYTHDPSLPEGKQVVRLRIGRRALDEKRPYRIAADEVTLASVTLAGGGEGLQDTRKTVLGALEDYIESVGKTLDAGEDGRVTRRPGGGPAEMAR